MISPVYSKIFLARYARSPTIHMMRYYFARLHLFILVEIHSHRRIPSLHDYKLLVIYKASQKIFLRAE